CWPGLCTGLAAASSISGSVTSSCKSALPDSQPRPGGGFGSAVYRRSVRHPHLQLPAGHPLSRWSRSPPSQSLTSTPPHLTFLDVLDKDLDWPVVSVVLAELKGPLRRKIEGYDLSARSTSATATRGS